jgi:hypothetical protein
MDPNPTSAEKPYGQASSEMIPPDAPFIYIDPEKTKKVVLISPTSTITKIEFDRLKAWFEDQFFVVDEGGNEEGE